MRGGASAAGAIRPAPGRRQGALRGSRDIVRWLIAILVVLILVLQYRLWVGDGSLAEVYHLKQQIDAQKAALKRLRKRNKALQAEVDDLRDGLEAVEERARSELGMIKEGEVFYQVIEPPGKADHGGR